MRYCQLNRNFHTIISVSLSPLTITLYGTIDGLCSNVVIITEKPWGCICGYSEGNDTLYYDERIIPSKINL